MEISNSKLLKHTHVHRVKHLGKNLAPQSSWPLGRKCKSPALISIYMNMVLIFLIFSHKGPLTQKTLYFITYNSSQFLVKKKSLCCFELNIKPFTFCWCFPCNSSLFHVFLPHQDHLLGFLLSRFSVIGKCWRWPKDVKLYIRRSEFLYTALF